MNKYTQTLQDGYTIECWVESHGLTISPEIVGSVRMHKQLNFRGCTIDEIPAAYRDAIRKNGANPDNYFWFGGQPIRNAVRPTVEDAISERERIAQANKDLVELNIPGLKQLRSAIEDQDRYHQEFARMMADGNNDGVRPPRPVRISADELRTQFPRADLFLRAEGMVHGDNRGENYAGNEREIGRQAMELLASGASIDETKTILGRARRTYTEID